MNMNPEFASDALPKPAGTGRSRVRTVLSRLGGAFLGLALAAGGAAAQTRAGGIEEERDQKARALKQETVTGLERVLLEIKHRKVLERITAGYNGLRFQMGNMATGSGFALGPEFYREDILEGQLRLSVSAALSTGLWQKYQTALTAPHLLGDRLTLKAEAIRRDYRSLEYYGSGLASTPDMRTDYRLEDTSLEGSIAFRLSRHLRVGGSFGGLWTEIKPGTSEELNSIETVFDDGSAPGLDRQANYLRSSVFGQVDYRDDPAGPKAGGNYVTEYTWYDDRSLDAFSFGRWDVDAQQYVAFFNKTRRFALRARLSMTDPAAGHRMPFYLQPYVGGSDDLRGFRPYRFTGPNAVVYNAEYRWEIFSGLDGAIFFDAAKVMRHRGHLGLSEMETSEGFGLRFNARNRTFIRLDVGFSREGTCVWLKFNDPFTPLLFGAGTRQPQY